MIKVATVCERSVPRSIMRRQRGIISVYRRKDITSESSTLTKAPTTPSEVSLRYSNDRPFDTVLRKGYRKSVM